ncbi:PaaI family thioesterase [Oscillibacter sp. 1-3]|uniref:PaaI family thioesterase n=1 Tax=Oscillibacter sp. 1-3 TaxID=1235797 RepID=UPI000334AC3A|nr:PaaI family thioesterase [Oscillibacter sp. 1-3]EOS65388.1 hypothetical protein C816_02171 [Oscillibacter sp. 1-3]MCI9512193.1 PaaI family thioesterase [Oscillibacter sp.]
MDDLLTNTRERLSRNAFMRYNHMELESVQPDRAVFRLDIRPESRNPFGMVHGGALYTLADNAAGVAVHTDGRAYVTQAGSLHFLRNQSEGTVRAEGRVRHRGQSTCLAEVDITGGDGALLATGEFTFFRVDPDLVAQQVRETRFPRDDGNA